MLSHVLLDPIRDWSNNNAGSRRLPGVIEILHAAAELQAFCDLQGWRFCFIGGLAVMRWGEPRETADVDLTLVTGFGGEEAFIQPILDRYPPRIPNAREFALSYRVLLVRAASGVGLDIALGGLPFEEQVAGRASPFAFSAQTRLRTCSAEDLVVLKSFAARPKDWIDVEGVIIRQTGKLDWNYVLAQLQPLAELKGSPEIIDELLRRRAAFER
jgi:hypothetical protein